MLAMIRAAYFRVYLPAEHSGNWLEHVVERYPGRTITIGDYGVWEETLFDDAFLTEWQGRHWVCPRYPRLRMLEGLLAFHNSYPGLTASLLAPEQIVTRAAAELESMYREEPEARSHILTSSWHVPLRWFAAFDASERDVLDRSDGSRTIRYRTIITSARARLESAIEVLESAGFDDSVVELVRDLAGWLEDFPNDALVELDYGSVARLFSDGELAFDETAADVGASLDALRRSEFEEAGSHYADAVGRWARAQSLTYAN